MLLIGPIRSRERADSEWELKEGRDQDTQSGARKGDPERRTARSEGQRQRREVRWSNFTEILQEDN